MACGELGHVRCGDGERRRKEGMRVREREEKGKKKRKEKKKGKKKGEKGENEKGEGVEGHTRENEKEREGGCKMQGVGTENCQGETLGFEVRWALGRFGLLSRALELLFSFFEINLAINF